MTAVVTCLDGSPVGVPGKMLERDETTLQVEVLLPFEPGKPVRIEAGNDLWLAEVSECRPEGTHSIIRVRIVHYLCDVSELVRSAERFMGRSSAHSTPPQLTEVHSG